MPPTHSDPHRKQTLHEDRSPAAETAAVPPHPSDPHTKQTLHVLVERSPATETAAVPPPPSDPHRKQTIHVDKLTAAETAAVPPPPSDPHRKPTLHVDRSPAAETAAVPPPPSDPHRKQTLHVLVERSPAAETAAVPPPPSDPHRKQTLQVDRSSAAETAAVPPPPSDPHRKHTLDVDRSPAAETAAMPTPPSEPLNNLEVKKPEHVADTEGNAFSTSHSHIQKEHAVDRVGQEEQENYSWQIGDYIKCCFQGKKIVQYYAAQVEAVVEGEPFVSFYMNSEVESEKLKKELKETALLRGDEIVKKLNIPRTEKRKRKIFYIFEDY